MENLKPHTHNGADSQKLDLKFSSERVPQQTVSDVAGTATNTYGTNERDIINDLKTKLNELIDKLETIGLLE